jgi:hypothetical protein
MAARKMGTPTDPAGAELLRRLLRRQLHCRLPAEVHVHALDGRELLRAVFAWGIGLGVNATSLPNSIDRSQVMSMST